MKSVVKFVAAPAPALIREINDMCDVVVVQFEARRFCN
jgi:hypothetical protein